MKKNIIGICALFLTYQIGIAQSQNEAARLAQEQLDAYNQRDIEAFLKPYSDTVRIYNFPRELIYKGKEGMRARYKPMFESSPDLHCTLMNRMVLKDMVIDQESVVFNKNNPPVEVFAMYKISGGKIAEVTFIRPEN